jgi:hypothetical protein
MVLALAAGSAGMAAAQTAPAQTPAPARYLNWAGRGEAAAMPRPTEVSAQATAPSRRPNRVIPHGGAYEAPPAAPVIASDAPRRTLTPATAWLRPSAPAPAPMAMTAPAAPAPSDDPMAPRRDAPIFRMQQTPPPAPAPEPQAQADAAPQPRRVAMVAANPDDRPAPQGSRYYSVHRQNGREPDPLTLPQPTYVDALAITTPVTIASQDLAQPDHAPTLIRDAQGRVRAQAAAPEGDYQ